MDAQTLTEHAAEIRARLWRTVAALGAVETALQNLERVAQYPNFGEPEADLVLGDYHLEEILSLLDTAGEHLTSVSDRAGGIRFTGVAAGPGKGGAA